MLRQLTHFIWHYRIIFILIILFGCSEDKTYNTYITNPVPDTRPPTVEWISVSGRAGLIPPSMAVRDSVELTVSASDESGIDSVKLYINGFPRFSRVGRAAEPDDSVGFSDPTYSFLWNTLADSDGVYSIEARAWDKAGNSGETPVLLVQVSNTTPPPPEDRTPPRITWLAPQPGSVVRDTVNLEFSITDSSHLDSIIVFIDGNAAKILAEEESGLYIAHMNSWAYTNGLKIIEVRAYDVAGNVGISNPIGLTIDNHRLIWVPDDYEKIQDAINASVDGDTVRVRAGTYNEGLRLMGKNIWLESEEGPEVTVIDGLEQWSEGIWITDGESFITTIVRGFYIHGYNHGLSFMEQSSALIVNCIIEGEFGEFEPKGIWLGTGDGFIRNCIIKNCYYELCLGYVKGQLFNTMIINCNIGFFKVASQEVWFENGWNLFWNNDVNYEYRDPAESDIFSNPEFAQDSYVLSPFSPAIDTGKPDILDRDGGRSDIGVYGGPFSYPPPNR